MSTNGKEELEKRGIRLGDDSSTNIANFVKAVVNNRLSSEAIHTFVSASKGSLEMVSRAVEANVATNTSINRESMMQIQQIVNAAKDGPIDANTLTLQLQQISAIMQGQRITQLHNSMSMFGKGVIVVIGLVLLYRLIRLALGWIGWLLVIALIGSLIAKFLRRWL